MEETKPTSNPDSFILIIEPFYGGSHRELLKLLLSEENISKNSDLFSLSAKKWHWRARTSALYFSQIIPKKDYKILFTTSVLNLSELISLRLDLANTLKIVYFHENQLVYPVREKKDRDFQYGYNQILTALVADKLIFNSFYNMNSFLDSISCHLRLIPDHRPKNLKDIIKPKCQVIYFPLDLFPGTKITSELTSSPQVETPVSLPTQNSIPVLYSSVGPAKSKTVLSNLPTQTENRSTVPLHIVWPHRWEHDKNPESFFNVLFHLHSEGCVFCVSVLGENYTEVPEIFSTAKMKLIGKIKNWGYLDRKDYIQVLKEADVVVSTANHEFFGVSMLEAVSFGCFPLCPRRLVYPELYPDRCLYATENQLFKKLKSLCLKPYLAKDIAVEMNISKYSWENLKKEYLDLLKEN